MRRIAIINQKGGVGKTTTTVNVGVGLARLGHRVLLIDLDPQAHLSLHLGIDPAAGKPGTYELLTGSASIAKARVKAGNNLWVVGSSIDLAAAEVELVSVVGREVILRDLLEQHVGPGNTPQYDYVLMDCPPSLSVLTLNGLCAAREVFIPLQPHYLALQGLGKLLETVSLVGKRINPGLKVGGVVVCMQDAGTRLAAEVIDDVRSFFEQDRNHAVPWAEARVFDTFIRRNIKLAEAPSYGKSIFDYAPDSNGAKDYELLACEIDGSVTIPAVAATPAVVTEQAPSPVEPVIEPAPAVSADPAAPADAAPPAATDIEPPVETPAPAPKPSNGTRPKAPRREPKPEVTPAKPHESQAAAPQATPVIETSLAKVAPAPLAPRKPRTRVAPPSPSVGMKPAAHQAPPRAPEPAEAVAASEPAPSEKAQVAAAPTPQTSQTAATHVDDALAPACPRVRRIHKKPTVTPPSPESVAPIPPVVHDAREAVTPTA